MIPHAVAREGPGKVPQVGPQLPDSRDVAVDEELPPKNSLLSCVELCEKGERPRYELVVEFCVADLRLANEERSIAHQTLVDASSW